MAKPPRRHELSARLDDPDLVDRIFDYVVQLLPEIQGRAGEVKAAVRDEFSGILNYVRKRSQAEREELAQRVLSQFNGRNATEVARALNISRATVYRMLKQPGRDKSSQVLKK